MGHRFRPAFLAATIIMSVAASAVQAQELSRDPFASLEARLTRLEAGAGRAIDPRSLARAHKDLWSLRRALASGDVAARDARRRLARLSSRLRDLAQGGATAGAALAAAGTGSISGTVTADGGAPLANVVVAATLIDDGTQTATTDATGRYRIDGLVAGDYKVVTDNRVGLLDEIYEDTPCPLGGCSRHSQGTTVIVIEGQTTSGIDFALSPGGRIAGRVTDAASGAPIAGAAIEILTDFGSTTTVTDSDGRYLSETGLPTGSDYVVVRTTGYFTEMFDNVPCPLQSGCDSSSATPVAVVAGALTGGIDFALEKAGSISGRITGSDTGAGIAGVSVIIFDVTAGTQSETFTDADGRYRSLEGLPAGNYVLRVFAGDAGYLDEGYDDIPCDNHCTIPGGVTAVPVTLGQDTSGIDFVLQPGGVITGRVTDGNTGEPLSNAVVEAITTGGGGFWNNFGLTDTSGAYRVVGLGTGTYRAAVDSRDEYLGEVWRELECTGSFECFSIPGTPIAVQAGATVTGIDFTPVRGGRITGRVVDGATNAPLAGVAVRLSDSEGDFVASSETGADGRYEIVGLRSGTFFAIALESDFFANTYVDELYGGMACLGDDCDVTRGRPIRVIVGRETSGIDFELDKGGKIAGRVTDAITGEPIAFAGIEVYDAVTVRFLEFTRADEDGRYTSENALPRGQFLVVAGASGYVAELYDDIACQQGCNGRLGTRVRVTPPAITTGIDFALMPVQTSAALRVPPR